MFVLNDRQQALANRIDCTCCSINRECDQFKSECPKVNFQTLMVDDISILKAEQSASNSQFPNPNFTETTKRDFERHLYGNIYRCRYQHNIVSFFSSEKETQWLLFFFSHQGRYYKAFCNHNLSDAGLDNLMVAFLYPDKKSFVYLGWLCSFDSKNNLFHLYTPSEREQPAGLRYSEMEVSTPTQAIEFINCY